jgi:hypothetical protein
MHALQNPAELFIKDYLELNSMIAKGEKWLPDEFIENPPRYYRILRAQACLRAMGYTLVQVQDFIQNRALTSPPASVVIQVQ